MAFVRFDSKPGCTAASPEQCITGLLCGLIGRLSGDDSAHYGNGSEDEEPVDPEEAAQRLQLVSDV